MTNELIIDSFTVSDINLIATNLETEFDNFWNYNVLKTELQNSSSVYLCCKQKNEIIGFAGITIVLDNAELNNIVIKKQKRGKGFSSLLLDSLIKIAKSHNCKTLNLEVASNNQIAINLYKKFGFKQVGMRAKYYNSKDDALLFTLFL